MPDTTIVTTTVPVAPATTVPPGTPGIPVDSPTSPALFSLADKRKKMQENLHLDLQVPRWTDPEIWVRFTPVAVTQTEAAVDKRRESKIPDWLIMANADILVLACVGVYAVLDGDRSTKYSLRIGNEHGPWTKFDADLAANLGIAALGASEVCKALYATDGDLLNTAAELTNWSSAAIIKADGDF